MLVLFNIALLDSQFRQWKIHDCNTVYVCFGIEEREAVLLLSAFPNFTHVQVGTDQANEHVSLGSDLMRYLSRLIQLA